MGNDHRKIRKILIFGNGKLSKKFLREIHEGDYIIGVDRAAYWLLAHKIIPTAAIGDFDSTTKQELDLIKKSIKLIKHYPPEKDKTDMELAITYADGLAPKEVLIFGATGTRLDHTLATLHMIRNHVLTDEYNRVRFIGRGKTIIERSSYRYISVLPYTKSITLSLNGFKYNVNHKTLHQGTTLGVSNEIQKAQGIIHIFSGKAWVIESND
jgi:thiamine pyrophosphokinase